MRLFSILLLFIVTEFYNYGYDGIELIFKEKGNTTIYSNYHARPNVRIEVGYIINKMYKNNELIDNTIIVIKIKDAKVNGTIRIMQKGKLTLLDFYYKSVEWDNGLKEIYKPNK